jgi:type VII secretion integral membrane protein EccD
VVIEVDNVDVSCRVTVVGSRRRLDVSLPVGVPVADLLWDLAEMLGEDDGSLPAGWTLVRVGGHALDPEQSLSEQGVVQGTMLFLRDITRRDPPPAIDDYAAGVALAVDAQSGRWTKAAAPAMLTGAAAACLAVAGLVLLLAGDRDARAVFGLPGAAIAAAASVVISRQLGRRAFGGLLALSALPLWGAAGGGLAGLADAGAIAILAAALGSIGVGAAVAILVAGEVVLVPSVGIITATLVPALVLGACALVGAGPASAAAVLCPAALASLALPARIAVRVASINHSDPASLNARARLGRHLLAAALVGIAVVLTASSAILSISGGWFAWGLVAASALGAATKARHFRFAAEVGPLLATGLAGLLLLEYPLIGVFALGPKGAGGAAAILIADGLILAASGSSIRRWDLSPRLRRQLGRLEAIATAATVPLALGVLGAFEAVTRLVHGFG